MELMNPARLASTVLSAKEELNQVADLVEKRVGKGEADRFRRACDDLDVGTVNKVLDKTVTALTGEESASEALYQFVKKFRPALCDAVSEETFEFRKLNIINQYYKEIKATMGG